MEEMVNCTTKIKFYIKKDLKYIKFKNYFFFKKLTSISLFHLFNYILKVEDTLNIWSY